MQPRRVVRPQHRILALPAPPPPPAPPAAPTGAGWRTVAVYPASNGTSRHTVERNGSKYRCTCQGFRIYKRGYCKHTKRAQQEGR